jgi:predicted nicotinamide N-methyase
MSPRQPSPDSQSLAPTSLAGVEIPGGWTERILSFGGQSLRLLLPAAPDEFINQLEGGDSDALPVMRAEPYWANLWSSAQPLAELILRADWDGPRQVLELGCGIGLAGLAARAGGHSVTWSDLVPEAVELALENARRNNWPDQVAGIVFDWRNPPAGLQFSRIIASDVLYQPAAHEALANTLAQMLAPDGEAWIADPGRSLAPAFPPALATRGLTSQWFDRHDRPCSSFRIAEFHCLRIRWA